ncbi:MAG TPA: hypothetical protein VEQ17_11335, partial [Steroidobacteraceae bacterium]|nr:hypothetical protein [Steroidobacteraceae bacterium]
MRRTIARTACATLLLLTQGLQAQVPAAAPAPPIDPVALAARVQQDVEAIRGLPFKHSIPLQKQSPEEFGDHLDKEMVTAVPEAVSEHFGKIV